MPFSGRLHDLLETHTSQQQLLSPSLSGVKLAATSPPLLRDVILPTYLASLVSPSDSGGPIQPTITLSNESADLIVTAAVRGIAQQRAQRWAEMLRNTRWVLKILV